MAKQPDDQSKEPQTAEIKMKEESLDLDNGILVYETNAENGTGFTLEVDGTKIKAKAEDGQVWFYAGFAIGPNPVIRLL